MNACMGSASSPGKSDLPSAIVFQMPPPPDRLVLIAPPPGGDSVVCCCYCYITCILHCVCGCGLFAVPLSAQRIATAGWT
jgi:hypothetical protein